MLINVGEAYVVVNIIAGSLVEKDQDLQQILKDGYTGDPSQHSLHIPDDLDINADDDSLKLKLKIFGGPSAGEIFYYKMDAPCKIVIGRTADSDIKINDKLLSKFQASIEYSTEDGTWTLSDGMTGNGGKPSTNGTWLYLNEPFRMFAGMVFKANQTIFKVDIR